MADLTNLQAAQTVKIAGANPSSGIEDNFMEVDSGGRVGITLHDASGSAINLGQTTMANSMPVVIASNQSAIPVSNFPTTVDTNYGTVGSSTLRAAAQIGNATGAAAFGAGTTGAQVLRVVLPTDQTSIPAAQSGTWTVQQGATPTTIANAWPVKPTDGTNSQAYTASGESKVLVTPLTNSSVVKAQLQDNSGTAITLGQKVMASSVPVVISSDQSAIAVSQSGTWSVGRTWTLASGTDSVAAVQSGTWTVQQGTPPWSVVGNVASGATDSGNPVKVGGVFNTALPTITNGQRGDIQLDSSARQIIAPLTNASIIKAQLQDNSGTAITLGQKVMASSIPVVIASDQSAFPVVASFVDTAPANGSITAFDTVTTTFVGANGQNFYTGTPTTNSAAVFALTAIENVTVQANLLGGGGTMLVEVSMDGGTFWLRPNVYQISTQSYTNGFTSPFVAIVNVTGMTHVRVRAITSWAGTATIIVRESANSRSMTIVDALPAGANVIGGVTQSGTWTTGRTWTLASGTDSVASVQSGAWTTGRTWTLASGTDSATVVQGTASALAGAWPVKVTDGTNTLPTMDVAARAGFQKITDGTNTMPTMDVVGRAGFMKITDGTDTAAVAAQGDLKVVDGLKSGGVTGSVTITTGSTPVEAKVGASRLTNRKSLIVVCNAAGIFWGYSNTVTTSTGMPTANGQVLNWTIDPDSTFQVWFCCTTNGKTITVAESP